MKQKNKSKNKTKITKIENDIKITPLVKSLIGVIKLPADYDYKKDYIDHLIRKHS
jgi:hypothetical protein